MDLYTRVHPYKHHRTKISHPRNSPETTSSSSDAIMPILNNNNNNVTLPQMDCVHHHHRLHCPGLLECDHCSSSSICANITTSRKSISSSSHDRFERRNSDDGGTNCTMNDNDNGVKKTLASNCCCAAYCGGGDTLAIMELNRYDDDDEDEDDTNYTGGGFSSFTSGIIESVTILSRWKDDCVTFMKQRRCSSSPLFQGSPPPPPVVELPPGRRRATTLPSCSLSVLKNNPSPPQWTRNRMTSFLYTFAILLLTCLPHLPVSYACSSRSTPKPRPPSPTLRPNITIQTYTCPAEYDAHYCLNGATCFTVKIGESILYNCECAEGYMGQRCEFKDLDGSYLPSKQRAMLEQAGVSGAVAIVIILVVIVLGYAYVRQSRRKSLARHSREVGDTVDGFIFERRPFSPYYYNNPSISISQDLHPSRSSRSVGHSFQHKLDLPSSSSASPPRPALLSHTGQSQVTSPSIPAPVVPFLHSTTKQKSNKPPDPGHVHT